MRLLYRIFAPAVVLTVVLTLFAGCTSTRIPGRPDFFADLPGQFRYTDLQPAIVTMEYLSEPNASEMEAKEMAGKHVARLCLKQGYRYFEVLEKSLSWPSLPGVSGDTMSLGGNRVARVTANIQFHKRRPPGLALGVIDARAPTEILVAF